MKNKSVILIVDDNPSNILALENLLAAPDRVVLIAHSGEDALKLTLEKQVDLILLDVQMPGMDGFEVAQVLRSNKRTSSIPVIFATAASKERNLMMKGYDEGAIDYLFKPLDPEIVKAKVTVLLKLQMQRRELVEKNLSLQKSELLINNSADIIGIVNASTFRIEEINNAFTAILGYSPEETKGAELFSFLTDEDKTVITALNKESKEPLSFETKIICKDKSIKWLQWKVVIKDGKWFVNARDTTEVKHAEEQIKQLNTDLQNNVLSLEASNSELESFSYSVSHDLRAPLRILNAYSQIIAEEYMDKLDDEAKKMMISIRSNSLKMGVLIDNLLEFSRLGRKEIQKRNIDIKKMVDNVLLEISQATDHHAKIKINSLPPANADAALLEQVWMNLISNAIKYSGKKENPEIEIGGTISNDLITYFVKDNGSGFDMKYADKLFGVFQRLHKVTEFEGTGVGLAIVHRIIAKHGGTVWADAKPGEGAVFYFTLPANQ